MKRLGKVAGSVLLTSAVLFLGLIAIGLVGAMPHKFTGQETFESYKEAQYFQEVLVCEAERVGAFVNSIDLSITSPPTIRYEIYAKGSEEFKYGKRLASFGASYFAQVLAGLAFVALAVGFNIGWWQEDE